MGLESLYLLIPVSVLLSVVALALFLWAMLTGQFDDLETPALRILFEEESPPAKNNIAAATPAGEQTVSAEIDPKR